MYCTIEDIKTDLTELTLKELTDDSSVPVEVIDEIVTTKINSSTALINSYVKSVASLPITDDDDLLILKEISVSLTVCELWRRRSQTDYPEAVAFRYKEAINLLKQISNGTMKLNTEIPVTSSVVLNLSYTRKTPKFRTDYFSR